MQNLTFCFVHLFAFILCFICSYTDFCGSWNSECLLFGSPCVNFVYTFVNCRSSVLCTKVLWLFELYVFSLAEFAAPAPLHSPNFNPCCFYFTVLLDSILSLVYIFLLDGFSFFYFFGLFSILEEKMSQMV